MLGADGNKPTGKPGQRKRKAEGKKAEARKRKTVQEAELKPDQFQDTPDAISAAMTSVEDAAVSASSLETPAVETSSLETAAVDETMSAPEAFPLEAPAAENTSVTPEPVRATIVAAETSPTSLAAIDWSPDAIPAPAAEPAASAEIVQSASAETAAVNYQTIANAYGEITRRSFDQTTSFFEKFLGVRSFDKALELQTEFAKQAYDNFVAEAQRIRDLHRELSRERLQRWEGFVGIAKPR
jgi:hypothetical protein